MIAQKGIWNTFLTVWRAWLSTDYSVINRIISMSLTRMYHESSQSWGVFIVLCNTITSSVYKLGVLYTGGNCSSPRHPHSASILNTHNTRVLSHFSRIQLCHPMDCNLPSSSVHGISQVRILDWVTMPFSRGSSRPRDHTHIFYSSLW